jgi:ActR/RegA family two-component response regulator
MSDTQLEKVLIIDDNSDYRKLIKTFIKKLLPGVQSIEYDPVFEGVPDDSFDWSEIDVLLLDHNLSIIGTTGLDILHQHHKKASFPATIMLTGAGTEEVVIRALKLGIYEYQSKQSLTKYKLKQSIIHAWEDKKKERIKKLETTQHNRSFSKEVFYESLEQAFNQKENGRVLIVIRPDDLDVLEEEIGIIGRDSLVNHIAKHSFEVFKLGDCNPNITRISDIEVAIQIDFPSNQETLEFNLLGLSKHLSKCTFTFSEDKYNFSVSIGVLTLGVFNEPAEQLIFIATAACKQASEIKGNSFYVWKSDDDLSRYVEEDEIIDDQASNNEIATKAIEEKENLEAELKAAEEAKNKAETAIQTEQEAKKKLQAELKIAEEEKEKAELHIDQQIQQQNEAILVVEAEERAKVQAEILAEQEAQQRIEAELKTEEEIKAKLQIESEMKLMTEEKKKLEAELKIVKKENEKLKAELKAVMEAAPNNQVAEINTIHTHTKTESNKPEENSGISSNNEEQESDADETQASDPFIHEAEIQIKKLIDEKRIIQTYQPVTAMIDDEHETKEIYMTGLQAIAESDNLNKYLSDTSIFSLSLQQAINEWILRQVFLRITENGTTKCQYLFLIRVTESWLSNFTLIDWLQKILSQTKKYNPGSSIILDIPLDIFNNHKKRAQELINSLHSSHQFRIALSNIESLDNVLDNCELLSSNLVIINTEQLKKLATILAPHKREDTDAEKDEDEDKNLNMLRYLKLNNIKIITTGIENSTLLTDAITAGTDYTVGSFIGEIQDNLVESHTVESFELT